MSLPKHQGQSETQHLTDAESACSWLAGHPAALDDCGLDYTATVFQAP